MPYKDPAIRKAKQAEYSRKNYLKNNKERRVKLAARRKALKEAWAKFKATLSCQICGFSHPAALDFHHTDPTKKDALVSKLVSDGKFKRAKEEVEKCVIYCANCHRIHHHEERKNNLHKF